MQRIDTRYATEDGQFQAGDRSVGQRATEFSAEWCNAQQEELAGIVEGFGRALDAGDNNQAYQAIAAALARIKREAIDEGKRAAWPIGTMYINYSDSRNPRSILGFGEWAAVAKGRAIVGAGSNGETLYAAGDTFGTEFVQLEKRHLPRHRFVIKGSTVPSDKVTNVVRSDSSGSADVDHHTDYVGNDDPHENRQPSVVVWAWTRQA